jgi:hypothetical protein
MKKKYYLMLITILLSTGLFGQSQPWVQTDDGQVEVKKVSPDGDKVKVTLENGEKKDFKKEEVKSYFMDGALFIKVPYYEKGVKGKDVFMESLANKEDQQLYKYKAGVGSVRYFVYKGENLVNEVTESNKAGFEKFFNVSL